jgi:succinyl-CoA synthetase beta subunit
MRADVARTNPELVTDTFLVERMVHKPLAELMVDIRTDSQFGLVMTLSSGGALIELIADAVTLILPASDAEILLALEKLKVSQLLNGFRGSAAVNKHKLTETIKRLANYVKTNTNRIAEIEINPLFVFADDVYVVDVLMQLRRHVVDKVISA